MMTAKLHWNGRPPAGCKTKNITQETKMKMTWKQMAIAFGLFLLGYLPFNNPLFAQTLEKPRVSIAVGGKNLFYYLPLTIAEQLGYFKDEGLQVEISDFAGGAKALQA